ncbi:putative nuclease HARBI1 [Triplophysa dalaica]|uniref:putative nuclease HARBI1 n=1 Tax=Triplophysa dalaica TaxID=1582913 RepID=UPI0024DFC12B|nr:putative nuclease HARBI1 [Triplophysa dalaica]
MAALQRVLQLRVRERQRQRRPRSRLVTLNAFIRQHQTPLDILDDMAIIRRYRLPRGQIAQLLNSIGPQLMRATKRNFALSPEIQLLSALRFYATGSFLQVLGDGLGLSKASVSRAVQAVTNALLPLAEEHIQFPASRQDITEIQQYFLTHHHIPQVIGVIDGTLIPILTPSVDGHVYICRKGYAAINCQVICDHKSLITDIVARWPESTHDSFMFTNSSVGQEAQNLQGQCRLLGDSGYPLRPYLFTPVANPMNNRETNFNEAHRVARSIVERTIGRWKMRFRAIHQSSGGLLFAPQKCCAVIIVTAMLHNIAVQMRVPLLNREEDEEVEEEDVEDEDGMGPHGQPRNAQYMAGFRARQQVIDRFF